jgi:DNA-binding helix-hairpin-helix protein with protein kinase domain
VRLVRASNRSPVRLGAELGRGGEGAVFELHGNSALVAKIYLKPASPFKAEKLHAMSRGATPGILRIAAWPTDVLVDEQRVVRGFLMPKVASREDLHELYSPKSRAETFPEADFRFVVRAATNLARAFATVHAQGHVIGDVNHGNALVGHDGTVVLIDCDSFQTRDRIKTYPCDVGVPLFTAPELQGRDFRGLRRSSNHDAFGLAVLLFHLLFQGRHPYAGRFADGDITIERSISEHRFAYSANPVATGMSPPPGTLALQTFGPAIAELFRKAFEVRAAAGDRPTALEWIAVLEALEQSLIECKTTPNHFHPPGGPCCWCELEQGTKLRYFGRRLLELGRAKATDVEALWRTITEVPHPGPAPELPMEEAPVLPHARSRSLRDLAQLVINRIAIGAAVASALAIFAGFDGALPALLISGYVLFKTYRASPSQRSQHTIVDQASKAWTRLLKRWNEECSSESFDKKLAELQHLRLEILDLGRRCKTEIDEYMKSHAKRGLRHYMRGIRIDQLSFEALSRSQRTRLKSYGISTAADVEREEAVLPNLIGKRSAEELIAWYRMHLRAFTGPPDDGQDQREIAAIRQRYEYMQERLAKQLSEGPEQLRNEHRDISKARTRLQPSMKSAWETLSRARQRESE